MAIDNDTRGWIMTCISGVGKTIQAQLRYLTDCLRACVIGASIICVDVFARQIPRWRNFSISESDGFLSASLSLSFGVMVCSETENNVEILLT
jgi:zinc transporter, ZIP family